MTGVVDVKEKRDVAVLDTANALLQADNNKTINMLPREKTCQDDGKNSPDTVPRIRDLLCKGRAHAVREAFQSSLRHVEGFSAVLQEVAVHPGRHG